jgi:hypothetical protein
MCGFWWTEWQRGRIFSEYSVLSCHYHSAITPYSSSSTCFSYQKDKRAKPGNLAKGKALLEVGEHCVEMYFHFFLLNRLNAARDVDWINLAKDGDRWRAFANTVMNLLITDMVE